MTTFRRLIGEQHETHSAGPAFRQQLISALPALRRFAIGYCRSKDDADDLVQSTVLRALEKHQQWSRTRPLKQWLFSILRNQWRDMHRRAPHFVKEANLDQEQSSPDITQNSIEVHQVHKLILELPDTQREVILMVAVEGMSYKDTAAYLEIPIGTVMSRLARARAILATRLSGQIER